MISMLIFFPTHVTELLIVITPEVFQLNIVWPNLPYNSWNFRRLDTLSNFDSFDFMISVMIFPTNFTELLVVIIAEIF